MRRTLSGSTQTYKSFKSEAYAGRNYDVDAEEKIESRCWAGMYAYGKGTRSSTPKNYKKAESYQIFVIEDVVGKTILYCLLVRK